MKLARAIALAAIPALLVTGCGGGNSTPALQSQSSTQSTQPASNAQAQPFDTSAADLHGGGATFPGLAYNGASQPVGLYTDTQALPTTNSLFSTVNYGGSANVYYCLTGSGFGRKIFYGLTPTNSTAACAALGATPTGFGARNAQPDFVGSDVALASTEYSQYVTNEEGGVAGGGRGEAFQMASVAGPIVFAYNPGDLAGLGGNPLRFSRWTYCAIANGTITDWNDAAITRDNSGHSVTGGSSLPIKFVYRSDGSGTSYLFQNHLNTVCGSTWSAPYNAAPYEGTGRTANWGKGTSQSWLGTTTSPFIGASGNPGVISTIQTTTGAVGYAEGGYVPQTSSPALKQARLMNNSGNYAAAENGTAVAAGVASMSFTMGMGSDGISLGTSRPECIFFINPTTFANPTASNAYPIVGVSYLMAYGKGNGSHGANLKKMLNYVTSYAATSVVKALEYQPLPSAMRVTESQAIVGGGSYSGNPCVRI